MNESMMENLQSRKTSTGRALAMVSVQKKQKKQSAYSPNQNVYDAFALKYPQEQIMQDIKKVFGDQGKADQEYMDKFARNRLFSQLLSNIHSQFKADPVPFLGLTDAGQKMYDLAQLMTYDKKDIIGPNQTLQKIDGLQKQLSAKIARIKSSDGSNQQIGAYIKELYPDISEDLANRLGNAHDIITKTNAIIKDQSGMLDVLHAMFTEPNDDSIYRLMKLRDEAITFVKLEMPYADHPNSAHYRTIRPEFSEEREIIPASLYLSLRTAAEEHEELQHFVIRPATEFYRRKISDVVSTRNLSTIAQKTRSFKQQLPVITDVGNMLQQDYYEESQKASSQLAATIRAYEQAAEMGRQIGLEEQKPIKQEDQKEELKQIEYEPEEKREEQEVDIGLNETEVSVVLEKLKKGREERKAGEAKLYALIASKGILKGKPKKPILPHKIAAHVNKYAPKPKVIDNYRLASQIMQDAADGLAGEQPQNVSMINASMSRKAPRPTGLTGLTRKSFLDNTDVSLINAISQFEDKAKMQLFNPQQMQSILEEDYEEALGLDRQQPKKQEAGFGNFGEIGHKKDKKKEMNMIFDSNDRIQSGVPEVITPNQQPLFQGPSSFSHLRPPTIFQQQYVNEEEKQQDVQQLPSFQGGKLQQPIPPTFESSMKQLTHTRVTEQQLEFSFSNFNKKLVEQQKISEEFPAQQDRVLAKVESILPYIQLSNEERKQLESLKTEKNPEVFFKGADYFLKQYQNYIQDTGTKVSETYKKLEKFDRKYNDSSSIYNVQTTKLRDVALEINNIFKRLEGQNSGNVIDMNAWQHQSDVTKLDTVKQKMSQVENIFRERNTFSEQSVSLIRDMEQLSSKYVTTEDKLKKQYGEILQKAGNTEWANLLVASDDFFKLDTGARVQRQQAVLQQMRQQSDQMKGLSQTLTVVNQELGRFIEIHSGLETTVRSDLKKIQQALEKIPGLDNVKETIQKMLRTAVTTENIQQFSLATAEIRSLLATHAHEQRDLKVENQALQSIMTQVQKMSLDAGGIGEDFQRRKADIQRYIEVYNAGVTASVPEGVDRTNLLIPAMELEHTYQYKQMVDTIGMKHMMFAQYSQGQSRLQDQLATQIKQVSALGEDMKRKNNNIKEYKRKMRLDLGDLEYPGKQLPPEDGTSEEFQAEQEKLLQTIQQMDDDIRQLGTQSLHLRTEKRHYKDKEQLLRKEEAAVNQIRQDLTLAENQAASTIMAKQRLERENEEVQRRIRDFLSKPVGERTLEKALQVGLNDVIMNQLREAGQHGENYIDRLRQKYPEDADIAQIYSHKDLVNTLRSKFMDTLARIEYLSNDRNQGNFRQFGSVLKDNLQSAMIQRDALLVQYGAAIEQADGGLSEIFIAEKDRIKSLLDINTDLHLALSEITDRYAEFSDYVEAMSITAKGREMLKSKLGDGSSYNSIYDEVSSMVNSIQAHLNGIQLNGGQYTVQGMKDLQNVLNRHIKPSFTKIVAQLKDYGRQDQAQTAIQKIQEASHDIAKRIMDRQYQPPTKQSIIEIQKKGMDLSHIIQHIAFEYGAQLFSGIPTDYNNLGRRVDEEVKHLFDTIDNRKLFDTKELRDQVGDMIKGLAQSFRVEIIQNIGSKFGESASTQLGEMNATVLGEYFKKLYNPHAVVDLQAVHMDDAYQRRLGDLGMQQKRIFETNEEQFSAYQDLIKEYDERIKKDQGANPVRIAPASAEQTNKKINDVHSKFFAKGQVPFVGSVLGKRSASIYDAPQVMHYEQQKQRVQAEQDVTKLQQYKKRVESTKDAIELNTEALQNDVLSHDQMRNIADNRIMLRKIMGSQLIPKVEGNNRHGLTGFHNVDPKQWTAFTQAAYNLNIMLHGPEILALLRAPIEQRLRAMKPLSQNDVLMLKAFQEEYNDAVTEFSNPGFLKGASAGLSPQFIQSALPPINDALTKLSGQYGQRALKTRELIKSEISDLQQYGLQYDEMQMKLLEDFDQAIIDQEVKLGGYGHMNQMMQGFSNQMERFMFDMLQKNGLDQMSRPMQQQQSRMVAQAGQQLRSGQIAPSAYHRHQLNPGQAHQAMGDRRTFAARREMKETQPTEEDLNVKDEQKPGGLLAGKTQKQLTKIASVSKQDLKFLQEIIKVDGKLMIQTGQDQQLRELNEKEKLRVSDILIRIVMILIKLHIDDMSEAEYQDAQRKVAEQRKKKQATPGELTSLAKTVDKLTIDYEMLQE